MTGHKVTFTRLAKQKFIVACECGFATKARSIKDCRNVWRAHFTAVRLKGAT